LGWAVVWIRSREAIQELVDEAPKAKWYFSDGFEEYAWLWFHGGRYAVSQGKSETYSVEGDNSECVIIWLAWLESLAAFLGALMLWNVHYECLSTHSTAGSCISSVFRTIRLM
jgi:hypothetical protein